MQIYEVFRRAVKEAVATPARPVTKVQPVGGVPNPLAQRMPGGMATGLQQTGTSASPSQMPNAAYGQITSNVPQMQRSGSRALATQGPRALAPIAPQSSGTSKTTSGALVPQASRMPAAVPGQGPRQKINVDQVLDAPAQATAAGAAQPPGEVIDVKAFRQPDPRTNFPVGSVTAASRRGQGGSPEYQAAQAQLAAQGPQPAAAPTDTNAGEKTFAQMAQQLQQPRQATAQPAAQQPPITPQPVSTPQPVAAQSQAPVSVSDNVPKAKPDKAAEPKFSTPQVKRKKQNTAQNTLGPSWLMQFDNYLSRKMGGPEIYSEKDIDAYRDFKNKNISDNDFKLMHGQTKKKWAMQKAAKLAAGDAQITGKKRDKKSKSKGLGQQTATPTVSNTAAAPAAPVTPPVTKPVSQTVRGAKPGAATPDKIANFEKKLQQAMAAQGITQ